MSLTSVRCRRFAALACASVTIGGLSCREAAGELGIRRGTVLSRLFRARRRLLVSLEPDVNVA
jgi:DNA-directed RNA polymerase specialized sigma24 family protein